MHGISGCQIRSFREETFFQKITAFPGSELNLAFWNENQLSSEAFMWQNGRYCAKMAVLWRSSTW